MTSAAAATAMAPAETIHRTPTLLVIAGVRGMTSRFTVTIGPDVATAATRGL